MKAHVVALLSVIALAGCASTGVVPADRDTYIVSKRDAQVGFGPAVGAKADVYQEATAFCAKLGKKMDTVNLESTNSGFARPASATLQFKCGAP